MMRARTKQNLADIALLAREGSVSYRMLAAHWNTTTGAVVCRVLKLARQGLVELAGKRKGTLRLTSKGREAVWPWALLKEALEVGEKYE